MADIVRLHGEALRRSRSLSREQERVLGDIMRCRTAELGGHLEVCQACGYKQPAYNSCRNRHCPKCQALSQARWLEGRRERILPAHYFHVVFTLPSELRGLARNNRALVFDRLFEAAASTLLELGRDPRWLGGQLGITCVLHTWTRELAFHPHVHCVVTGGGLSDDGARWLATRSDFLLPVRVMGALFRGKLMAALEADRRRGRVRGADDTAAWHRMRRKLYRHRWVVYCKPPFGGPDQVFAYLGRYTHRVAISNHRLLSMDERGVTFKTRHGQMATLPPVQFLSRLVEHVLPCGFVKIRHYGLNAASNATTRLEKARALLTAQSDEGGPSPPDDASATSGSELNWPELLYALTALDLAVCPRCGCRALQREPLPRSSAAAARAPPVIGQVHS